MIESMVAQWKVRNIVRVVADRYELVRRLDRDEVGRVWEGVDRRLGFEVAVKLIDGSDVGGRGEASRRFYQDARIAGRLRHPGIPVVYDFGEDVGEFFVATDLLPGWSLDRLISEVDPLTYPWAAAIGAQICVTLAVAHAAQLPHRNLKPTNVLIGRDGAVTLLDLGAVGFGDFAHDENIGSRGAIRSAGYLAPELMEGVPADPVSDLYSVGCLLYEMLTGHRVFESDDSRTEIEKHRRESPVPVSRTGRDVPDEFERLVMRLLAKERSSRPRDAMIVGDKLTQFVTHVPPLPGFVDRFDSPVQLYAAALDPRTQ